MPIFYAGIIGLPLEATQASLASQRIEAKRKIEKKHGTGIHEVSFRSGPSIYFLSRLRFPRFIFAVNPFPIEL